MKKQKRIALFAIGSILLVTAGVGFYWFKHRHVNTNPNPKYQLGQVIDTFNGVSVHYNGSIGNVTGRNTVDGYNVGLKHQCVEFVKRYYLERLNHKMPDSYGNAKDFFDKSLKSGEFNKKRSLLQYSNDGYTSPKVDDLIILDGHLLNPYGHVAIISKVTPTEIEVVQQNPGAFGKTRDTYSLTRVGEGLKVNREDVLGWLRKTNGLAE